MVQPTFSKIAIKDYQESQFQILDYEIQSLSASSESPNIAFTGFRYSDGVNVVGTITETDEVIIDNVAENGNKIINYNPQIEMFARFKMKSSFHKTKRII